MHCYCCYTKTVPGAKTIKKNTNSTQIKSQTHRAKQYEVTSFLSTDCELSTETCSKNVYSLGPWKFGERRGMWTVGGPCGKKDEQREPTKVLSGHLESLGEDYSSTNTDLKILLHGIAPTLSLRPLKRSTLRLHTNFHSIIHSSSRTVSAPRSCVTSCFIAFVGILMFTSSYSKDAVPPSPSYVTTPTCTCRTSDRSLWNRSAVTTCNITLMTTYPRS